MLTDPKRGPFEIQITEIIKLNPTRSVWNWKLISNDGKCYASGNGYETKAEAQYIAKAVARGEMC